MTVSIRRHPQILISNPRVRFSKVQQNGKKKKVICQGRTEGNLRVNDTRVGERKNTITSELDTCHP